MAFVSRLLLVLNVLLFSGRLFASTAESFLLDGEDIASYQLDDTLILSQQEFITNSVEPALIVGTFQARGHDILVVERNGEQALLADNTVLSGLSDRYGLVGVRMTVQAQAPSLKNNQTMVRNPTDEGGGGFCGEGCWGKAVGGAIKGALLGGLQGATAGGIIGGPPGASIGAGIGGTAGAVAGGIDGHYECEKDKAALCKNQ
jgi:hypothetical protein